MSYRVWVDPEALKETKAAPGNVRQRLKRMLKVSGINVYPTHVEEVLRKMPEVEDVCVIGVPDDHWGESVAAYVVKSPEAALDADAVIAHCRANLASYKKPRYVLFVESLPRGTTNKVNKNALRAQWAVRGDAPQP